MKQRQCKHRLAAVYLPVRVVMVVVGWGWFGGGVGCCGLVWGGDGVGLVWVWCGGGVGMIGSGVGLISL